MNSQSREINSMRNISISILTQSCIILLNFIAKSVFIKVLGADYLGINGLFYNVFMLFSFAEFGIGSAMVYSLYDPIAKGDTTRISALYSYYKDIYRKLSLITMVIGLLALPILNIIVRTENNIKGIQIYYLAFLLNTIIYNLLSYKSYLIIADQRKFIVSIIQTIFESVALIAQIIVLLVTHSYLLYLLIVCLKTLFTYYAIEKNIKKSYTFVTKGGEVEEEDKKKIIENVKAQFIYKFARVLIIGTDNIIISMLVGTVWVGYYSNYDLVVMGVASIITVIFSALSASIGNLVAEKSIRKMYDIFKVVQVMGIWISGFTTICMLVLFQDFIKLWLGERYVLPFPIVIVIAINYYLSCVRDSTKIFREAAGLFVKIKNTMILTATINIILSILLGKIFGVFGVLIATTIAILTTYYWYEPLLIYKTIKVKKVSWYFKLQLISILLIIIGMYITNLSLSFITEITWISFFIKMFLCVVISNLYYVLILSHTKEFKYVLNRVRRILDRSKQ